MGMWRVWIVSGSHFWLCGPIKWLGCGRKSGDFEVWNRVCMWVISTVIFFFLNIKVFLTHEKRKNIFKKITVIYIQMISIILWCVISVIFTWFLLSSYLLKLLVFLYFFWFNLIFIYIYLFICDLKEWEDFRLIYKALHTKWG